MHNLYGGIVSNIASGITGGPGITPGANIGNEYAMFDPRRRLRGKDLLGKDTANPTGILFTGSMMLRRLNFPHFADALERSVNKTITEGHMTEDLGGNIGTKEFVKRVIDNLDTY